MNWNEYVPYIAVALLMAITAFVSRETPLKVKLAKVAGDVTGALLGYYLFAVVSQHYTSGMFAMLGIVTVVSVLMYRSSLHDSSKQLWGFMFHVFGTICALALLARFHIVG